MSEANGKSDLLAGAGGAAAGGGVLFEQQVGAWICSWMLAEMPIDPRFGLGADGPMWVRLETEAPVDDVLVATDKGGYVVMQLKKSLSASSSLASEFGKTIEQFVRHWFVCSTGIGQMEWDRPLNPSIDRLVLAVGPEASSTIKQDFVSALQSRNDPGNVPFTQAESEIWVKFETCVSAAWVALSGDPQPPKLLQDLVELVRVISFDPNDQRAISNLQSTGMPHAEASVLASLLLGLCGRYIAERSGADTATLRKALAAAGANLPARPSYRNDILKLKEQTSRVGKRLKFYEEIDAGSGPVSVPRDCQTAINRAAREGSLLIIGDPGVGKSAVLNTLATSLRDEGKDVLELAVDGYSVETLEGLQHALRLEHPLTEVVEAWDGCEPAWLIIDALDAARGGRTEAVFRGLLAEIQQMAGRWIVVASIRSFDLQMGVQYRNLFAGRPPSEPFADQRFSGVRHVSVPQWTNEEFERVLDEIPPLRRAIVAGGPKLREVAMVPFNARLLCDLIKKSGEKFDCQSVTNRLELLQTYWAQRVESLGLAAEACLAGLVGRMVSKHSLRVPKMEFSPKETPSTIEDLLREGIIRASEGGRQLEFSHHLLFDYATSRVYIDLQKVVDAPEILAKDQAPGLMLAPGMVFALQDHWNDLAERGRWWATAITLVSDERVDPIIRSVVSRVSAELPTLYGDFDPLIARLVEQGTTPAATLSNVVGAFVVRLEDGSVPALDPWARLAKGMCERIELVEWPLRILCHQLIDRLKEPTLRADLGEASRELLRFGLAQSDPRNTVVAGIGFVADTYETDADASRCLLEEVLRESRFDQYGSEEIPALARKIRSISAADPAFAIEVYEAAYGREMRSDRQTSLGASRIMPLRSNARQDFEIARYSLSQFFPELLKENPEAAVDSLLAAYQGFVNREHVLREPYSPVHFSLDGLSYVLQPDLSHIWASDPEGTYATDADALLAHLWRYWQTVSEDVALVIASLILKKGQLAVYWARLFDVAARRGAALAHTCWALATREEFLLCTDTNKPAMRLIGVSYASKSVTERKHFELSTLAFDYSRFKDPEAAKLHVESLIFGSIDRSLLVTDRANSLWVDVEANEKSERDWLNQLTRRERSAFHWIEGLDESLPANAALIVAIEQAKAVTDLSRAEIPADAALVDQAVDSLETLASAITDAVAHPKLVVAGLDMLGDITEKVLHRCLRAAPNAPFVPDSFVKFMELAATSPNPTVTENTEREFEESAGWGSPAGRISAAASSLMIVPLRPDLYEHLKPLQETLLADSHPAVRLQSSNRLVHIWDVDRPRFWSEVHRILATEQNASVVEDLVANRLARFQVIARPELIETLTDFVASIDKRRPPFAKVGARAAEILFLMWLRETNDELSRLVWSWVPNCSSGAPFLNGLLHLCRDYLTDGLIDLDVEKVERRGRAIDFMHKVVLEANEILRTYYTSDAKSEELTLSAQACSKLVDDACMQIYFAADGLSKNVAPETPEGHAARAAFMADIEPTLDAIGRFAETHTVYYLMQILEGQIAVNPEGMFDLLSSLMLSAGQRTGLQYESLGADLFVRLVGIYLADHKEIFDNQARRHALVACLDVFILAGWPSARRLLYHLADLVQ